MGVPALAAGTPRAARGAALAALLCLTLAPLIARRRQALGRGVGVVLFMGLSAGAWSAMGPVLSTDRFDPVRAVLGFVAFCLYALGWGSFPGDLERAPAGAASAIPLAARQRLPRGVAAAFALLVAGACALPVLAFQIEESTIALFGHALALAGAIGVLAVGTRALLIGGGGEVARWRPRASLWLLAGWLLMGVGLWVKDLAPSGVGP